MSIATRTRASTAATILTISLLVCGNAPGVTQHLVSGRVDISHRPEDAGEARRTAAAVEYACGKIRERLGISFEGPVNVSLARGREEFNQACGTTMPDWALAAAVSGRSLIVVDASRVTPATANDLNLTVLHETVHLALGTLEQGRPDRLPRWFHEGVAAWLSGQRHFRMDDGTFAIAAAGGALTPFDRLNEDFPAETHEADLAYLQSEAFIAHIASSRSAEALQWIVDRYRGGEPFDEAFTNALGVSRPGMEREWAGSLRKRFPWLTVLWHGVTMMTVLAAGTLFVYIVVRIRARRQRRAWEREEAWAAVLDEEEGEDPEPEDDAWRP